MEEKHSFVSNKLLYSYPTPPNLQLLFSVVGFSPGAAFHIGRAGITFCSIHPRDSRCLKQNACHLYLPSPAWPNPTTLFTKVLSSWWQNMLKTESDSGSPVFYCYSMSPSREKTVWNNKAWMIPAPCLSHGPQIDDSRTFVGWKLPAWLSSLRFIARFGGSKFFPVFMSWDFCKSEEFPS